MALSSQVCLGRRTLTGLLTTSGQQFHDWSAAYRLFEKQRFDAQQLFAVVRRTLTEGLPSQAPVVALLDDTQLRKTGRKIAGTKWQRDALGPPFHPNFIWAQRFLQISAALPEQRGACRARAIPIDFCHCPSPRKPRKNASPQVWEHYRQEQQRTRLSQRGVEQLSALRNALDRDPQGPSRPLMVSVDGTYTNRTVLRQLPSRTTLIGRIRKDARLHALPQGQRPLGRRRAYGPLLPTPEQFRQDPSQPWLEVPAFAAGKVHRFQLKTMTPLRWRAAGAQHQLRLIVIRPLAYRLSKHSPLLYRQPVYLICTDAQLPLREVLQYYLWRWEIEVNFRDEKTLLGTGEAQVRTPAAVETVPAFLVASYAFLLLAAQQTYGSASASQLFPAPKWRKQLDAQRLSTAQTISLLRAQLWGRGMNTSPHFSHFAHPLPAPTKPQKLQDTLFPAVFYASG